MSSDVGWHKGQAESNAEAWFNIALRPRKPESSLGLTAQDGHLDSTQLLNYDCPLIQIIMTVQYKWFLVWFKSGVHNRALACKRRHNNVKGRNSGASQWVLWQQFVTCSAHSMEH